jgi:CheY-like chemotaxis protein
MKNSRPILLVEDDVVDVMTVERALNELRINNPLVHLKDGKMALEYLQDENCKVPCIILLDLNVPRMDGLELMKIIKANEKLKSIPIIVMTMSDTHEDIHESFDMGVAGYIVKPVDFDQIVNSFGTIDTYWSLSELPHER